MTSVTEPILYPPDLASHTRLRWEKLAGSCEALPEDEALSRLMGLAFYASCLSEESRAVRCRLILAEPDDFKNQDGPPTGFHVLSLDPVKPLTSQQIGKMAFAAHYYRSLIGVRLNETGQFVIWGVVDSGPRWVSRTDGGRAEGAPLPHRLVIEVLAPGHIAASCGFEPIAQLRGGRIAEKGLDPFLSQWLPQIFDATIRDIFGTLASEGGLSSEVDEYFIRYLSRNVIRRSLSLVRNARHGGMLVLVPCEAEDSVCRADKLRIGYAFQAGPARNRYRRLMTTAVRELARAGARQRLDRVGWTDYQHFTDGELADVDEAVFEMAHLFADLMAIDGALVMTPKFELIGFDAEIITPGPVEYVYAALDTEGTQVRKERIDSAGTRHRAAYRLCYTSPEALAIVISQDGGVRFVRNVDGKVVYWDYEV